MDGGTVLAVIGNIECVVHFVDSDIESGDEERIAVLPISSTGSEEQYLITMESETDNEFTEQFKTAVEKMKECK